MMYLQDVLHVDKKEAIRYFELAAEAGIHTASVYLEQCIDSEKEWMLISKESRNYLNSKPSLYV